MSTVGTVQEAMRAVVSVGTSISQQSNYIGEVAEQLESAVRSGESIKLDIESNMHNIDRVKEYFEKFAGVLAVNEMPHAREDSIKENSEELSTQGVEVASKFEEFFTQVRAALETLNSINEGTGELTDAADTLAGEISDLASD